MGLKEQADRLAAEIQEALRRGKEDWRKDPMTGRPVMDLRTKRREDLRRALARR